MIIINGKYEAPLQPLCTVRSCAISSFTFSRNLSAMAYTSFLQELFATKRIGGLHNSCCLLTNTKAQSIYYCLVAPQYEPTNINESFNLGHIFQPIIQSSGFSSADQQKDNNILTMRFFIKFVSWGDSSNIYQPSEWTRKQNCSP